MPVQLPDDLRLKMLRALIQPLSAREAQEKLQEFLLQLDKIIRAQILEELSFFLQGDTAQRELSKPKSIDERAQELRSRLEREGLSCWRQSSYNNGNGRVLWLNSGALVMIPAEGALFVQGKEIQAAEALLKALGCSVTQPPEY